MEIYINFVALSALFFLGGLSGWVIELFFRRIFTQKRWVNPGFLSGPMLPLYGFGLTGFYIFANFIPFYTLGWERWQIELLIVLVAGVAMTLIEYIAGLIFIKGLKTALWDYSDRLGNIQGIICPLFSFFWLLIGAVYVFLANPLFVTIYDFACDNAMVFGFVDGLLYGVLFVDFGWSIGLLTRIRKAVKDSKLIVYWENIKVSFQDHYKKMEGKHHWIFAFRTKREEWNALMNEYILALKNKNALRIEEKKNKAKLKKEKKKD